MSAWRASGLAWVGGFSCRHAPARRLPVHGLSRNALPLLTGPDDFNAERGLRQFVARPWASRHTATLPLTYHCTHPPKQADYGLCRRLQNLFNKSEGLTMEKITSSFFYHPMKSLPINALSAVLKTRLHDSGYPLEVRSYTLCEVI